MAVTLLLFRKVVKESRQVMPLLHMKTICLGCSGRRLSGQSRAGGVPPQLPIWDRQNSRRTERTCKKLKLCPPQVQYYALKLLFRLSHQGIWSLLPIGGTPIPLQPGRDSNSYLSFSHMSPWGIWSLLSMRFIQCAVNPALL